MKRWAREELLEKKQENLKTMLSHPFLWLQRLCGASFMDPAVTTSSISCSSGFASMMASTVACPWVTPRLLLIPRTLHMPLPSFHQTLLGQCLISCLDSEWYKDLPHYHTPFLHKSAWVETSSSLPVFILHFVLGNRTLGNVVLRKITVFLLETNKQKIRIF